VSGIPARPKKGRRFGGDAAHQKAMFGNLVASLIAAEGIVTTEAKAKALRPVIEKVVTKARRTAASDDKYMRQHQERQVVAFIRDKDMAYKLFEEIGPRYIDRQGGYTRILKLGTRHGDNAPMARIEFV
jgi:large subunit ribosomal protein L17